MWVKRIVKLWQALTRPGSTPPSARNAELVLALEQQALQQALLRHGQGLAAHRLLAERLERELLRLQAEKARLLPRIALRLQLGERAAAGRHALRVERIDAELEQLAAQLAQSDAIHKELVRSRAAAVVAARERIEALRRGIGQLKLQEALAELSELSAGMQGVPGTPHGTLEAVQARLDARCDFAAGRVRVARELSDVNATQQIELEQEALASAALARFERAAKASSRGVTPRHEAP